MSNRDILKNGLKNLGISVDDKMLNDFNIYREILVDWNQKMNLTGIEDEKEVYIKHFLDSVSAVTNGYIKDRSEERRVGKESRSGWWTEQ